MRYEPGSETDRLPANYLRRGLCFDFRYVCCWLLWVRFLFMTQLPKAVQSRAILFQEPWRGKVVPSERDEQESLFNYYFQDQKLKYETQFEKLKTSASVPKWRIPYSADIHPQVAGGLSGATGRRGYASYSPLSTYDRAFNSGRESASSYETQRVRGTQRTLFPGMRLRRNNEGWEGYCSGFTASTIRHPEPIRAVDAGTVGGTPGAIFQPSDIKALLSSIYNRTTDDSYLYLAPPSASDGGPNMGTFHLALANYIGNAGHAVGFDRTKGRAVEQPHLCLQSELRTRCGWQQPLTLQDHRSDAHV